MRNKLFLSILFILVSPLAHAERIIMQGTAVIGNQELPKVLYIVPWQKSELPDLSDPPLESLIDEALAPIDRNVFRRQVEYYRVLSGSENQ
ncbi:MAG: hypothetical protein OEY52_00170 [Gammaproteobacteria bacterium]|nr:hypothetical protein [Gammaproteobacteria bacterium]